MTRDERITQEVEIIVVRLQKLDIILFSPQWLVALRKHLDKLYIFQEKYYHPLQRAKAEVEATRPAIPD